MTTTQPTTTALEDKSGQVRLVIDSKGDGSEVHSLLPVCASATFSMANDTSKDALISETSRESLEDWKTRLINPDSTHGFAPEQSLFWTSVAMGFCLVDKTLLIRDTWECSSASLVLRPRRFGKSFGLDMINAFYSIFFLGQGGRSVEAKEREEFFLTTRLGKEDPDFVRKHCGKYPVLLVSLQVRTSTFRYCGVLN